MSNLELQQIKELVEKLSPQERIDLAEWFEAEIMPSLPPPHLMTGDIDWTPDPQPGHVIAEMLRTMEPIDLVDPHITDPVEWVEAQRQKRRIKLEDEG